MKKTLGILVVVLALAFPITTFAATSNAPAARAFRGFCGIDTSKLNTQQKSDMLDSFKNEMAAKKNTISKMVQNGTIAKEQGDAAINRIDEMTKYRQQNGFNGNYGISGGSQGGNCGIAGGSASGCGAAGGGYGARGNGTALQVY